MFASFCVLIQLQLLPYKMAVRASGWAQKSELVSYYRLHLAYFILLAVLGALLMLGTGPRRGHRVAEAAGFLDWLFAVVSALCLSGLASIPIEDISVLGQVLLFFMMILGGQIVTSLVPLEVKKWRYYKLAKKIVDQIEHKSGGNPVLPKAGSSVLGELGNSGTYMERVVAKVVSDDQDRSKSSLALEQLKYLLYEYRAVSVLSKLVVLYYTLLHLVGFIVAWSSIVLSRTSRRELAEKGTSSVFFASFAVVSAFANCGYILDDGNMVPFNTNVVLELDLAAMVLLGNTLFPPALRALITVLREYSRCPTQIKAYEYLLDHHNRCYPHLFDPSTTSWLLVSVAGLNALGTGICYIVDWNSSPALVSLTGLQKLVNAFFLSVNTRTGGINSVNLIDLSSAVLLIYCIMMYIAGYPIQTERKVDKVTIRDQTRRWLRADSAYLFFSCIIICIAENKSLKNDPLNFNIFNIVFEVMSAYGNVGLSMGYSCSRRMHVGPSSKCADSGLSFSGKFGAVGKLVIIYVMMLGRHRGLPDHVESALTATMVEIDYEEQEKLDVEL